MELTEEQRLAVETEAPNALVVAGAGTGKTTVIERRVLWLAGQDVDPKEIAVVTYTNEAARIVSERFAASGVTVGFCGTLHNFCLRTMREMGGGELIVIDEEERGERLLVAAREMCVDDISTGALVKFLNTGEASARNAHKLEVAVSRYLANCERDGLIDFESILRNTARDLIQTQTTPPGTWEHLIVDEWQDAEEIDWQIYSTIPARNRFFVGDPLQAIFGFRSGRPREIDLNILDGVPTVFYLTKSWRSTPEICAAASRLSKHARLGAPKALYSFRNSGADVRTRGFRNEAEEALALAVAINVAVGDHSSKYDDFAVLCRTNAVADYIAEQFKFHDIPVRRLVQRELPDDWRLAVAALGWLARPDSHVAARRFAQFRQPDVQFERVDLFTRRPITGDADKLELELAALGISEASIAAIALRFSELPETAALRDLECALTLEGAGRKLSAVEGVFVGTIHGAKGREFERVVLAAMEEEIIPSRKKSADVDEERRVAYVGMTRAKTLLWLTWARSRRSTWGSRAPEKHEPSRFIGEALNEKEETNEDTDDERHGSRRGGRDADDI